MNNTSQISEEDFDSLLNWLSNDSNEAGIEYENIRRGLLRYFRYRGCADCHSLVDETINRVAKRLDKLNLDNEYKKLTIFYGFAANIYKEYVRDFLNRKVKLNTETLKLENEETENDTLDNELDCLEKCLKKLSKDDRYIAEQYFRKEKGEKIKLRKKIAEKFQITSNTLNVRVYRIRQRLRTCINQCMETKNV